MSTPANHKKRPAHSTASAHKPKAPRPALRRLIAAQFAARSVSLPRMNPQA